MRFPKSRRASLSVFMAAAALFAAACGSDGGGVATGSTKQFCADWSRAKQENLDQLDMRNPKSLRLAADSLGEIVYPAALTDVAEHLMDGMRSLASDLDDKPYFQRTPKERQALLQSHRDALSQAQALRVFARRC